MSIIFISDVHLCIHQSLITNGFLNFLNYKMKDVDTLYILGDLFEEWLGDDDKNIFHTYIAHSLKKLSKKIACYFIHGNHDFLLGERYADLCGMKLLPIKNVLQLSSGKKIVILHGDILGTNDFLYKQMRKLFYSHKIKKIFLSLPLIMRSYIFNIIRASCLKYKKLNLSNTVTISPKKVIDILIKNQADVMIHGHVHQSAIYKICNLNKTAFFSRIVLGCWNKNGSMIKINERNESITLIEFPL